MQLQGSFKTEKNFKKNLLPISGLFVVSKPNENTRKHLRSYFLGV